MTHYFWWDVVRCSEHRVCSGVVGGEDLRDAKVSNLDDALLCEEDVGRLQIPVKKYNQSVISLSWRDSLKGRFSSGKWQWQVKICFSSFQKKFLLTGKLKGDMNLTKCLDISQSKYKNINTLGNFFSHQNCQMFLSFLTPMTKPVSPFQRRIQQNKQGDFSLLLLLHLPRTEQNLSRGFLSRKGFSFSSRGIFSSSSPPSSSSSSSSPFSSSFCCCSSCSSLFSSSFSSS